MEIIPRKLEAEGQGESFFTLILKNHTSEPKNVLISGLQKPQILKDQMGKLYYVTTEMDTRAMKTPVKEICSVNIKIKVKSVDPGNHSQTEEISKRGLFKIGWGQGQIEEVEVVIKNDKGPNQLLEKMFEDKVKNTESNYEESEAEETSFEKFKRKLEQGTIDKLKMVSSLKTGEIFEKSESEINTDVRAEMSNCRDNSSITENEALQRKVRELATLLQGKQQVIEDLGGFVVYLESQLMESSASLELIKEVEFMFQEGGMDLDTVIKTYYQRKMEAMTENDLRKKTKHNEVEQLRKCIMEFHSELREDWTRELVLWGQAKCTSKEFFREDFGFFRYFGEREKDSEWSFKESGLSNDIFGKGKWTCNSKLKAEKQYSKKN